MLIAVMKEHGITQRQVAAALGLTEGAVSQKFSQLRDGSRRPFTVDQGREIALLVSEVTGRDYTVDELFFAQEEGAA